MPCRYLLGQNQLKQSSTYSQKSTRKYVVQYCSTIKDVSTNLTIFRSKILKSPEQYESIILKRGGHDKYPVKVDALY